MKLKNLKKETLVKITNDAEFKALLQLAEEAGYSWNAGQKPTERVYNDAKALYFCVDDKTLTYSSLERDNAISIKKVIKFEVGDKVKIREDLSSCDDEEYQHIIDEMKDMAGKTMTVSSIYKSELFDVTTYKFERSRFSFRKKWIEPVFEIEEEKEFPSLKEGDFVKVIANTRYDHNFPIGSYVKVARYTNGIDVNCEGYCKDRDDVDTQLVYVGDIEKC